MENKPRTGVRNVLRGIPRGPLTASLFSTGVLLTYGYASQMIFTVGDVRQLEPLFLGVIVGVLFFSLLSYVLRADRRYLGAGVIVSVILLVSAYAIIVVNNWVLGGTLLLVISIMMTSVYLPVSTFVNLDRNEFSFGARMVFGILQSVFSILFILVYAVYYELTGQMNFYIGPVIFLLLSLAASGSIFFYERGSHATS